MSREIRRVPRDFGLEVAANQGSHAKLFRRTASGERRVFTAPVHAQLLTGTLRAIYRQASRFVAGAKSRRRRHRVGARLNSLLAATRAARLRISRARSASVSGATRRSWARSIAASIRSVRASPSGVR